NSGTSATSNVFNVSVSTTGSPKIQAGRNSATSAGANETFYGVGAKNTLLKVIARFDATGNQVHLSVNGRTDIVATTTGPYSGGGLAAWDSFLLGKQPFGGTPFYFDGLIFEVNLWNTFLSDTTKLANLASYATTKWGS